MKDFQNMPGHLARRFQQIAVAAFHGEMAEAGFDMTPVQFAALSAIVENPGIDQATLAGLIAYDRTTIGGVVDRLAHKELVERNASPRDRRARVLTITGHGEATLEAMRPAVDRAQQKILRGLDGDEAETLMRLLNKAVETGNELSRAPQRMAPNAD